MKDLKYCISSIQLFVFSAQAGGRGEIVGVYVPWLHLASQGACQGIPTPLACISAGWGSKMKFTFFGGGI